MIDVHAHLCFPEFNQDREEVIAQSKKELAAVIVSSARYDESCAVLDTVKRHRGFLFASIGHHPIDGDELEKTIALITEHQDDITAIGEVGLDFHWEKDLQKQEQQKQAFQQMIDLAERLKKPLIIHSWDAEQECFEMVKDAAVPVVFHCYSGHQDLAREIANHGCWISISTNICFSKRIRKVAKQIPFDRLLLETDSPFLDPDRERKRNTPVNIRIAARQVAKERGTTEERVLEQAKRNAIDALGLSRD